MGAISDLWKSERGLIAVVLILSMSVLTGLGSFTGEQWIEYSKWISTVYIGSKTITGAIGIMKGTTDTNPPVAIAPAPAAPVEVAPVVAVAEAPK